MTKEADPSFVFLLLNNLQATSNAIDVSFIRAALLTRSCIAGTGWKVVHNLDVLN